MFNISLIKPYMTCEYLQSPDPLAYIVLVMLVDIVRRQNRVNLMPLNGGNLRLLPYCIFHLIYREQHDDIDIAAFVC